MLTLEERELLGLGPERASHRPSAVSQVLRAVARDISTGRSIWNHGAQEQALDFDLHAAAGRATRERIFRLAYRVYRAKGYVPALTGEMLACAYDTRPDSLAVLAEDALGNAAGTVSLVFDGPAGLPCDEIFGAELATLRAQGRRPLEVARLAIDEAHARSKALLTLLCNVPFAYGLRARNATDLVIEVHPRHAAYYLRLLCFEPMGPERPCPRVGGSPALLLRANLEVYEREMRRIGGQGPLCGERSLFPYFYAGPQELELAWYLASQHRPMTEEEARYFGLVPAGGTQNFPDDRNVRSGDLASAGQPTDRGALCHDP